MVGNPLVELEIINGLGKYLADPGAFIAVAGR